ncbi:MAG TPA: hypothetical protein VGK74_03300 [Symbiobacteriaceae bacterium]|jgi:drug/metabolite transporter (DMT)-like permease
MMFMWIVPLLLVLALVGDRDGSRRTGAWPAILIGLLLLPIAGGFLMGGIGMGATCTGTTDTAAGTGSAWRSTSCWSQG